MNRVETSRRKTTTADVCCEISAAGYSFPAATSIEEEEEEAAEEEKKGPRLAVVGFLVKPRGGPPRVLLECGTTQDAYLLCL